jgi:gliding motility-associated-like protein
LFNGIQRTSSGTYLDTLLNSQGCDSFLTLNLSVKFSDTLHIYDTMCELQSYFFNNRNEYTSGLYRDTFTNNQGCDSFVFLHLHVKDTSYHAFSHITPCDPNASFMFNGLARTQSGIYSAKYLNVVGCDSTAVLNLMIRKPTAFTIPQVTICPGNSYFFNGQPRTSEGTYTQIITNSVGCDSTVTLNLKVLTNPASIQNPLLGCTPFTFEGKTYTSSITFKDTLKSVQGCDSVFRTNSIQLKPPATTIPDTNFIVCDSIRLNNRLYTNSFSFIDTFRTQGALQCDSVYRKTNYIIRSTPQIGLKERDTFMRGSQVTLRPFSATNYLWSTGQTTKDISFKLTEDRQLYLIAWNEEPCRDTAYISLVAEDLAIVGMPTGFSPTGEHAENRTLRPNINGRLEYFHMMVFNRWGEKVYETFDTQPQGWNGIFKGELAPSGLYGYVMEYRTLGIIYHKSGEVMLVR